MKRYLSVLYDDGDTKQLLSRQTHRQRHRLWVLELDVRDALEASRLIACDQSYVTYL